MKQYKIVRLILTMLVIYLLMAGVFTWLNRQALEDVITHTLTNLFSEAFKEEVFGEATTIDNDALRIQYIARHLNNNLDDAIGSHYFSLFKPHSIKLIKVDDIRLSPPRDLVSSLIIAIPRNSVMRSFVVEYRYSYRWLSYFVLFLFVSMAVALFNYLLPKPFSAKQKGWVSYLLDRGYPPFQASALVSKESEERLMLDEDQQNFMALLHRPELKNFGDSISVVNDVRYSNLKEDDKCWFRFLIKRFYETLDASKYEAADNLDIEVPGRFPRELKYIWSVVTASNTLEFDLNASLISIRGVQLSLTKTPLFYYAYYAQQRLTGDGWVKNPRSNKPDYKHGSQLASMMWQFGGHGKAINDLEDNGLKAKTLDQNRSRIKEEVVSILGEELAWFYLFESERDLTTGRLMYRLRLEPEQIFIPQLKIKTPRLMTGEGVVEAI